MNKIDLILMGTRSLFRRKVRTFLTILGVIIGTSSIVTMMSLGYGMSYNFEKEISTMGNLRVINVMQGGGGGPYGPAQGNNTSKLDDTTIAKFSKIPGVEAATPVIDSYIRIASGKYVSDISIKGIIPETMKNFDIEIGEGRLLEKDDGANIVFGAATIQNFRDPKSRNMYNYGPIKPGVKPKVDVLRDKLLLTFDMSYNEKRPPTMEGGDSKPNTPPKLFKVKGVGILRENQQDKDYSAYMSIYELSKLIKEASKSSKNNQYLSQQLNYQTAMVKVKDMKNVKEIQAKIKGMGFEAYSLTDFLDSMQKTSNIIQMVLGGLGAISLLVAALGITNTMIMSIYERTREIGIMKVIGASLRDIKLLFLFESGTIGFLGGVIGLVLSGLVSFILNTFLKNFGGFFGPVSEGSKISIIPIWLCFFSVGFAMLIGLISGYYPAKKAMKLSALEAIKTE